MNAEEQAYLRAMWASIRRPLSVIIKHVRHRWQGAVDAADARLLTTDCGVTWYPFGGPRDWAVHEPANSRCGVCYS